LTLGRKEGRRRKEKMKKQKRTSFLLPPHLLK